MENKRDYDILLKKILNETLEDKVNEVMDKLKFNPPGSSFDYIEEGECNECGGEMSEGECNECGYKKTAEMLEIGSEELEIGKRYKYEPKNYDKLGKKEVAYKGKTKYDMGKQHHHFGDDDFGGLVSDEDLEDFYDIEEITEKLFANKKSECMECGDKYSMEEDETSEGNAFTNKLRHTPKGGKFKLGNKEYTDNSSLEETYYRLHSDNESELFTESEIVDMIEQIVMEEKENNIKKGKTPPGLAAYEKAYKGSGKENNEYMKSLKKKMEDYTKDGSKEKFTTEPKHFPKGNGELEKMSKKAYVMSDDGNEFLDDYMRPGMEDLVPDEITYDEDWVKDNIKGSSRTGNNPEWANAEETKLGEKIVKKQKDKKFHKAKEMAYRKAKQPVTDGTGENSGTGVNIKLESVDKKAVKLNEEFDRMKNLMGYKQKTQ
jgi:hypothetical protein